MSQIPTDEVLFCDASVCFSEDEWKLLQEWQKELYGNVMKEIHQALMSLGPLIATTVFSLRAKEKQELCSIDLQESERRQATDTINNNDPICGVKREENLRMSHPKDTEEVPVSIFIDPPGEEVEEINTETNPGTGQEIISLFIKDEEETYCIYHPESKRRKGKGSPMDEGARNIKKRPMYSVASSEKIVCSPLPGETRVKTFNNPVIRIDSSSPVQPGNNQDLEQGNSAASLNVEMLPEHSEFEESPTNVQISEKRNDFASSLWNANLLKSQPNPQISLNPSACPESETFFRTKHQRTNAVERPYHCIECEKSFILRHHLIQHQRTHTGERPYQCTECHKRFSLKGNLNKHQRTHIITFENTQFRGSVHMGNPILENNSLNNLININHVEKF